MCSNSFLREKEHSKYLATDKISDLTLLDIMLYNVCLVVIAFVHSCFKYDSLIMSKAGKSGIYLQLCTHYVCKQI